MCNLIRKIIKIEEKLQATIISLIIFKKKEKDYANKIHC